MKKLNPEHIKAILELINQGPYFQLLSMEVCKLDFGYCRVDVNLEMKHLNPFGGLHGGVYASIIDTAAYWAVYCDLKENVGLISLDLKVDNLSTVKDGKIIVEGKRLKAGRSICLSEATVTDTQGKLLAHGTSKQLITTGLQSINQAVTAMGYQSLPPKFL
ncbi:PaaI family thioesterase [Dehalobacterium formicoaceticum]|uniref:PaaI family thioesterase n=1 Tax=Dehalobacterium formicoaceticum TaxID=51515 RepID=A0ABT1Y542_9FIRM|nr:PaaI family thioesterase [Dehalobacterium formicoaceticum]MCR6545991.1 PaaI family thioesterase [Dehalobacterium formicoaceticum]